MKEILLTQGQIAQVDDEDYDYLMQWHWMAHRDFTRKDVFYVFSHEGERSVRKQIWIHRLLMKAPKGMDVDHVDGNGLNNQKLNLRICTHRQNTFNRSSNGAIKYKGVSRCTNRSGFRARIRINNKEVSLGYFKTEIEAAYAYDNAARKYHGEFANLNFKDSI